MNKSILFFVAIFALPMLVVAQQVKVPFKSSAKDRKIVILAERSELTIEGYNGKEVVIEALSYEKPPARAEGLKPLYGNGVDNTGIGLAANEENNVLTIGRASRGDGEYKLQIPNDVILVIQETTWESGDIKVSNFTGEIEIDAKTSDIVLKNVSGPFVLNSVSGDIVIEASSLNPNKPSSISAISGFIDLTLPSDAKVNLRMSSISSEIYTDHDVKIEGSGKGEMARVGGGSSINGTLNGGGVLVELKAISGDIYLRRKK